MALCHPSVTITNTVTFTVANNAVAVMVTGNDNENLVMTR